MTTSRRVIAYFALLTAAGSVLVPLGMAARAEWSVEAFFFLCPIVCWLILPYLMLWLASLWLSQSRVAQVSISAGMLITPLVGIGEFAWMFRTKPDAQSGLLILFLPLWQMAVVVPCVVLGILASIVGPWTD